ncbi:hypothetical protein BGX27_005273 [Mortierella sp. AM989]|nr:hypothetical protein BGX27_005273 [Mortierella sp. AM989]
MFASIHRNAAAKSARSLVPQLGASTTSATNFATRRFKSTDAPDEEEPRRQTTGLTSDQLKVSRGNFRQGDIYNPSDLNDTKPITFAPPTKPVDELKILKLNPIVEYKNAALLSHYITPLGRLMSREQTGLSAKNQRRVTKAVRRARALCIISPTAKMS